MKKFFVAALAALTMAAAAAPALADDYRGDGRYRDADFRRDANITVRMDGRNMRFDRGDRMFYRLLDRPYNFRPGRTYVYTDRCNRAGCRVLVFAPSFARGPIDSTFAPRLFRRDRDGRWNDRDGYRGDDRLEGSPRW